MKREKSKKLFILHISHKDKA